ncbi:MAG: AlpA family transcriptional regulator [Proteobacteria bacterium]|nr:AlpA family transcriptional regulator [Pseudomonadota bacterium]
METKATHQRELPLENPQRAPPVTPQRILRLRDVMALTGLSRSSIYQYQAQNRFPKSIKVGDRTVGWIEEEVLQWIAGRIKASRPGSGMTVGT